MQSLYEFLKASKGLPVSDMYAALWGKSVAESGIKTITGRLPLYFRTNEATEFKLRDWVIYGNNDIGKNIFSMADFTDYNRNNVVMTADKDAGIISIYSTDTPAATSQVTVYFIPAVTGNYLLSGVPRNAYSGLQIYCWDSEANARAKAWDKTTASESNDKSHSSVELYLESGKTYSLNFRVFASYGKHEEPVMVSPMIRLDGTSSTFEPYQVGVGKKTENGYVVNIGVGFAPIPSNPAGALYSRKTINIGESPLTEGQTLSLSQFGDISILPFNDMYIAAFEGFAGGDQLSYNQPEMMIKYKE